MNQHKYIIIGDTMSTNINIALDIIVNKIPSFSGIHLLGFVQRIENSLGISKDIMEKIEFSCKINNLLFLNDVYNKNTIWNIDNKDIVYIVNKDTIKLNNLDNDHRIIYMGIVIDNNINNDFEIFIKYDNCYYNDNIVYNYKKYSTEELTSEFKKKL